MLKIEIEQEADGRWIAEVPALPGVLAYGDSREQAIARAEALARPAGQHAGYAEPRIRLLAHATTAVASSTVRACSASVTGSLPPG